MYFAAATQFTDPFEGAVAVQLHTASGNPGISDSEEYLRDSTQQSFQELKRLTKINCWHRADYESDAMWKLYAGQSKGIAICSTPDRIRASFRPFRLSPNFGIEDLWAGPVCYRDLIRERIKPDTLRRFFYKHQAFSWEREFRLAISLRLAEELGVAVPELGVEVVVDIDALVERIMLGPALPEPDRELIVQHAKRLGLGDRVVSSSLLCSPRYF